MWGRAKWRRTLALYWEEEAGEGSTDRLMVMAGGGGGGVWGGGDKRPLPSLPPSSLRHPSFLSLVSSLNQSSAASSFPTSRRSTFAFSTLGASAEE